MGSEEFDATEYIPVIDAIIKTTDSTKLTPKRLRRALQDLFDIDLELRKADVDRVIRERYSVLLNGTGSSGATEGSDSSGFADVDKLYRNIRDLEQENRELSAQLNQNMNAGSLYARMRKRQKKDISMPPKLKATPSNSFNKKLRVTPELAAVLGSSDDISRPQIVKGIWDYIKAHDLQNPDDRRVIRCDEMLKPLFGNEVNMFSMNKLLKKFVSDPDKDD